MAMRRSRARFGFVAVAVAWVALCQPALAISIKVATVHFGPVLGDVTGNRVRLIALSEEAAAQGAKVIVHTEMATSGYAYFSRAELSKVAEEVPGPTTAALGAVAAKYGAYIA